MPRKKCAMLWGFGALACCLFQTVASVAAVKFEVEPTDSLIDTPFAAHLSGMRPGNKVVVSASFTDQQAEPQVWTASATYRADDRGQIDTAALPALAGTYNGVVPGGLACSALPVPREHLAAYVAGLPDKPRPTAPVLDRLTSFSVTVSATLNGRLLSAVTIVRHSVSPDVRKLDIDAPGIHGVYYEPVARQKPGLPVLVAAVSADSLRQAMLLASRGHPAFALDYINHKVSASALMNVPVETLADGAAWLSRKTGMSRVALMGISRGSEAVQLAAGYFPQHVSAIIAYVPSPVIHGPQGAGIDYMQSAWTIAGVPVPYAYSQEIYKNWRNIEAPPGVKASPTFLPMWENPVTYYFYGTPLSRIHVPMLLLGAGADDLWPSGYGARKIQDIMMSFGQADLVEAHIYPDAGHGIANVGLGNAMSGLSWHAADRAWYALGGQPEADCQASFEAWRAVLKFLEKIQSKKLDSEKGG